ncbi:hypothetical protein [Neobacillus dielmonensis]|uniref:hypothetical protein n=1 Tax=Neobacillus dielmonensis TaxID=1347369 RepID=UPI0005A7AEEC|nr:hypothetical protein [Neobacillus dielmonensis]
MPKERNNENNQGIANSIKETAGSAFHTVHSALETTENVAMSTVDAAANAVNNLTGNDKEKNQSNE